MGNKLNSLNLEEVGNNISKNPMPLLSCSACGQQVSSEASKCLNCGHPTPKAINLKENVIGFSILFALFVVISIAYKSIGVALVVVLLAGALWGLVDMILGTICIVSQRC